jgi:lipid-A-disaccharide synthase
MSGANLPAKPISLMLVCGEPSGDQLGGQLMAALRAVAGDSVKITGIGGPAMAAQGLKTLFSLDDTAVMGLREVVPKIPKILARVRQARDFALVTRPDAIILIDSPDFTHRIARAVKRADPDICAINYVAPQVWATRAYRARAMARYFDLVLALLPFEAPFFERHGLHSVFVGHPVLERATRMKGGKALRRRLSIAPDAPVLVVLPGSRTNEIRFILPAFRDAVRLIATRVADLTTILPTLPHMAARVSEAAHGWPTPVHIIENEDDKFAAFDAANAALAASGTVTTELALSRTPFVSAYRLGWVTYALGRSLFKLPYFTLVNLLLERQAIPEFLQANASPENLANAVVTLLTDCQAANRQVADLDEAAQRLGQGGEAPSMRAARAIVDFVRNKRR